MARLKLNLPSGAVVEKPLITCFSADESSYLILDAENIGSMGLPIILVCKIENNIVKKIMDQSEWQKAKDYLKSIIAGNKMNYIKVNSEMEADEVYYTQLTLPVASFDVIKNSYEVEETVEPVAEPVIEIKEEVQVTEDVPVIDITRQENPIPSEPIMPEIPVIDPVVNIEPVINVTEPVIPEVSEIAEEEADLDIAASKEAFLQACENMFDALVAKFQSKIDSKK